MFKRGIVRDGGLHRDMVAGDGLQANYAPSSLVTDAAIQLTVTDVLGGLILRSGATANRIDTVPTGANLELALEGMDVGDTASFKVSNTTAFTITLAGSTGVTASGNLIVTALDMKEFILIKDAVDTYRVIGL